MKKLVFPLFALSLVFAVSSASASWFDKLRKKSPNCVEKLANNENASSSYLQDPIFQDYESRLKAVTRAKRIVIENARSIGEARACAELLWQLVLGLHESIDRSRIVSGKTITVGDVSSLISSDSTGAIFIDRRALATAGFQSYLSGQFIKYLEQ